MTISNIRPIGAKRLRDMFARPEVYDVERELPDDPEATPRVELTREELLALSDLIARTEPYQPAPATMRQLRFKLAEMIEALP